MTKESDRMRITKVNRYYDSEYDIEYFDFEINGDTPNTEEETEEIDAETNKRTTDKVSLYDIRWCCVK